MVVDYRDTVITKVGVCDQQKLFDSNILEIDRANSDIENSIVCIKDLYP